MFRFRSPGQPGESLVPIFLSMKIPEYAYAQGLKEVLGVGPCAAKRPSVSVVSIAIDGAEIGAHARPAKRRPPQSDLAGYAAACMTTPLNPQGHAVPTTDRWPLTAQCKGRCTSLPCPTLPTSPIAQYIYILPCPSLPISPIARCRWSRLRSRSLRPGRGLSSYWRWDASHSR